MKTASVLFALLLVATTAALVLGGEPAKPDTYKPVDTYADHQKFCFKKCTHFKSLKGKCVDFEWVGTRKECCQWKKVGKGKCLEFKKIGRCVKRSKPRKICIGHGYRQFCSKVRKHKICAKWEWKELCKKHGHNNACKDFAFHFICTKFEQAHRCAEEIYIPKIKYFFKQRCARFRVNRFCSKYKTITKTVPKWIPVTGKHYKGWIDHYWHQILTRKSHRICVEVSKRKKCVKFERVKFSKKIGYEKKCVKFITKKFCVQKKKIKFCTKFTPSKFCAFREKVRICKKFRTQKFCCAYKAKPFCTQFKFLKPRCVKKKFKKICVKKSPGFNICKKFQFVGGKKVCRKFAKKSVCAKRKTICSKVEYFKHKKHHKKEKKPDTYKPEKKPDTYKQEKKPDTYK